MNGAMNGAMSKPDEERLREMLRAAVEPVGLVELQKDLWPRVQRRLEERAIRVSGLDWVLAALVLACRFAFPRAVPALLYQL